MVRRAKIDPFQYTDYRKLLADYYSSKKSEGRGFSYRSFARKVGLRTPNHLKLIIEGQRNLTDAMAIRYAKAIGFVGEQTEYFLELVAFNQAKTSEQRQQCYQRLAAFRGYRKAHRLDLAHSQYYSHWWLPAIRELVLRRDFCEDPEWIAKQLVPNITTEDASRALGTLVEIGLLTKNEDGKLSQNEAVLTTGAETDGVHIVAYHKTMMEKASASIDFVRAPDRDISSLTFCTGPEGLRNIKKRIQEFRKELIAMACVDKDGTQVVQLNMQLFPLSSSAEDNNT